MSQGHDPGHGHSPAAWTAVIIMTLGISAGTIFFYLADWTLVLVSGAITVIGAISGPVLAAMGYGVKGPKFQPKDLH